MRVVFAAAIVMAIVAFASAGPFESEQVFQALVRGGEQKSVNLRDIDTDSGLSVDDKLTLTRRRRDVFDYSCNHNRCNLSCQHYRHDGGVCVNEICTCVGFKTD